MTLSRRRFLCISAAAGFAGLPAAAETRATWRGVALGAPASLQIAGLSGAEAAPIFAAVESELNRLEQVFSLYRPTSALARLNQDGALTAPPADLLELLGLSDRLHHASNGAFDPTVQPLFALNTLERTPTKSERTAARAKVGWDGVEFDTTRVTLTRPGAALTLNGIAQGYVTDHIAALLTAQNLTNVLVDMGEVRGLGGPWNAGVQNGAGQIVERITLTDRALATSAPYGSRFGDEGHIYAPMTGRTSTATTLVSVTAPTAAVADGLSTALAAGAPGETVTAFPGADIAHLA